MPEFLVPLTLAVIVASILSSILTIWAWRRELSAFFGFSRLSRMIGSGAAEMERAAAEMERTERLLLDSLRRHAALEARLIERLATRKAAKPDVLEFEATTRTVTTNISRLKRLVAQRERVTTGG